MSYCIRCGNALENDDYDLCLVCSKHQSEGPDVSDGSPNYEEKIIIHQIYTCTLLVSRLSIRRQGCKECVERATEALESTKQLTFNATTPPPPEFKQVIKPPYPRITPTVTFNPEQDFFHFSKWGLGNPLIGLFIAIIGLLVAVLGVLLLFVTSDLGVMSIVLGIAGVFGGWFYMILALYLVKHGATTKQRKELKVMQQQEIHKIANSPQYINACKQIDANFKKQCEEAKQKYEQDKEQYYSVTIKQWEYERDNWETEALPNKIKAAEEKLQAETNEYQHSCELYEKANSYLEQLYKHGLLPSNYREYNTVGAIYEIMNSSRYDTKTAIEMYDRQRDQCLRQAQIEETQRQNELNEYLADQAEIANQIAYEHAALQAEANDIADGIKIYQNHRIIKNTRR